MWRMQLPDSNPPTPGPPPLPPLPYQLPTTPTPPTPRALYVRKTVYAMAALWWVAAVLAGVGSDRVHIPLPKKIAISASAVIVSTLLFSIPAKHYGWAVGFLLLATHAIFVMWFWN
jgi:hypothetical protein